MKKKQISLVTGGAGFIGSHVVDSLIAMGHDVIVLDDLSGGFERNINKLAHLVNGSVTNYSLLSDLFEKHKFDYIFHLAAYAAEGLSHFIRRFNYKNNLLGSANLINLAVLHQIKRFVFTSSIAVYGTNQTPMVETLTPLPEDPYGISKLAVELDLKAANHMFGLNYTIFRPHNVYGERQNHGDPYRNVLGIFINNLMLNKPMTIFGDGKQTRAFSYIKDVAPYIAQCINMKETKNEIYNVGADKPYTVLELAELISKEMEKPNLIKFLPPRKEVLNAYADHTKFKTAFNMTNTTPIDVGIKHMVAWSKQIGPLHGSRFGKIEIDKNLPESWRKLV